MALTPPRRIAIFGATGGTGSATVRSLIKRQDFADSLSELRLMSIVDALDDLKSSCAGEWKRPRLLLLSSSTWNDRFAAQMPAIVLSLLKTAFYHPYLDLRLATSLFAASPELLSLLLVQPPAIVEDEPTGVEISTESVGTAISYADLGDAFVELALQDSYAQLDTVGVSSKVQNPLGKYGLELLSRIVKGLIAGYMPGMKQG
ncbi:hypothetical protein AK830_g8609 [Neonectria ditissima]|uniref:NAD(P)-binding domain-containing protein n=1 Tax=Neonectria ditissima TaxID=78410 RepID=A0A0N8H648_9HYPO|nr:hypothetical protein AK830_g8609 [Neonectria ditissima]